MTTRPIRAALYARVSTLNHGQDVGLQLDELRQAAVQRGWVATEFIDRGVSGSKDSRPALDEMMAAARAGKFDLVAVWRFDRFARGTRHLLTACEELQAAGVGFFSLREQVDTSTPVGKAMFTIISAIAELERDILRERVVAGVRRAQAAGKHCGRPRVEMDLRPALALLKEGRSLKETARILDVSRNTLRRRLREAGEWPIRATGAPACQAPRGWDHPRATIMGPPRGVSFRCRLACREGQRPGGRVGRGAPRPKRRLGRLAATPRARASASAACGRTRRRRRGRRRCS